MKSESWLGNILYKEVYVGEKEKDGKVYQKYKLVPRFKFRVLLKVVVITLFLAVAIMIIFITVSLNSANTRTINVSNYKQAFSN